MSYVLVPTKEEQDALGLKYCYFDIYDFESGKKLANYDFVNIEGKFNKYECRVDYVLFHGKWCFRIFGDIELKEDIPPTFIRR